MKTILRFLLLAPIFLFGMANTVHSQQAEPPYDLTGTWELRAIDVQRSFCDGSKTRERVEQEVTIIQTGTDFSLIVTDDLEEQIFEGQTSNFFIGAEHSEPSQVTVLTGEIRKNANKIVGTLVFFDRHECPEAETGEAKFRLVRVTR